MSTEKENAYKRTWYAANKDKGRAYCKAWRTTNKEKRKIDYKDWYANNKEKKATYDKTWRESNKARIYSAAYKKRAASLAREKRYGLNQEQYNNMYLKQLGLCAICHDPLGDETPHVDHCHTTKKIRGLTHGKCNTMLGYANDHILKLGYAMEYLAKHSQEEAKNLPHIKTTISELMEELNIQ